jgi:hypothetical protein
MTTRLIHPLTVRIAGRPGPWLPTAALVSRNRAMCASWPARHDPEPHDVRRISDLLAASLTVGEGSSPLQLSAESVMVSVACDTAGVAATVPGSASVSAPKCCRSVRLFP